MFEVASFRCKVSGTRVSCPFLSLPGSFLSKYNTPKHIANSLAPGEIIAYPTEGVWGLGCRPDDQIAVEKILCLKARSWTKGLILVASRFDQLAPYVAEVTERQKELLHQHWPGPVTFLMVKSERVPAWISGTSDKVAVRVSNHPTVVELCNKIDGPIVSTSANPTGEPEAMNAKDIERYFASKIDYICDGDVGGLKGASEIRDLQSGTILRVASE